MEYKRLSELQNTYPNVNSYKPQGDRIVLNGLYPETNQILFAKPDLSTINTVSGSSFRFILGIQKDEKDENPKYYTSDKYYNDLKASIAENNPYFPLESIKNEFIVTINLDETLVRYANLKPMEEKWGVSVTKNIFLSDNGVNYNELVKYIDWVVTKPNALDIDSGGVIPAETIGVWTSASLDFGTLTYKNKTTSTATQTLSPADTQRIQNELNEVNSVIKQIEEQLSSGKLVNTSLFRVLGLVSFFPLSLLLFNQRRKKEAREKLEQKLTEYKNKKSDLEKQLNSSSQTTTPQAQTSPTAPQAPKPTQSGGKSFLQTIRERLKNQI